MIQTLRVNNLTVFPEAEFVLSRGLNVLVGENGTGKTHILKLAYAILRAFTSEETRNQFDLSVSLGLQLMSKFRSSCVIDLQRHHAQGTTKVQLTDFDDNDIAFQLAEGTAEEMSRLENVVHSLVSANRSIFIPTKEILSIYPGFRAALKNRELAFDGTYLDLAEALDQAPYKGDKLKEVENLYLPLEEIIHAQVQLEGRGEFIFTNLDKTSVLPADMAAEGHRKLGMLAYLIKNGSIQRGTTVFWDEPEANLNPKHIQKLAAILANLSIHDVQIVIATHSLFLLRELEILEANKHMPPARYFGLHFNGDAVTVQQGNSSNDIGDIAALDADLQQSQRYLDATDEA